MKPKGELLLLLAASLGAAGCGSSIGTLRGKVRYNGALLKGGTVTIFCADGRSIPTGIREDGGYTLEKLPLGQAKICVDTSSLDPTRRKVYSYAPPPGKTVPPQYSPPAADHYVAIPAKYADSAKTDLTWEVTGGSQTYDIDLK